MRFHKTQVITFANQKGGCGKTSASVATAAAFAHLGYSATLLDTDPQCNATETFGVTQDWLRKEEHRTLADVYLAKAPAAEVELDFGERFDGRLFLVPGHPGLNTVPERLRSEAHVRLASEEHSLLDEDDIKKEHRLRLRSGVESLRGLHDVVIIDTPPELGFLMTTALIASDWFIIPVFPSGYDLKGMEKLAQTVKKIRHRYNPSLRLAGVLLGNYDKSTKLDRQVHEMLVDMFGAQLVFGTTISRTVRHREATFSGKTILEHAPGQPASLEYISLVQEMINRGQKTSIGETANPLPGDEALDTLEQAEQPKSLEVANA